ncbi:hypothetical protein ACFQFC_10055 [Amorphoplanes digitatis]|uniref:hypothetical protein n=1 Tax=Actinoplanes digitatis TaxID=1868 RepID=UPI00361DF82B
MYAIVCSLDTVQFTDAQEGVRSRFRPPAPAAAIIEFVGDDPVAGNRRAQRIAGGLGLYSPGGVFLRIIGLARIEEQLFRN